MRVIIEVDDQEELERVAALLGSEVLKNELVEIRRPPTRAERQTLLEDLFRTYRVHLPEGWKIDREELHRRDRPPRAEESGTGEAV